VEDVLSWIQSFASREAPALIRDGGRLGIQAIIPTAAKLEALTSGLLDLIQPSRTSASLPEQFSHARVRHPVSELQRYLAELVRLAKRLIAPAQGNVAARSTSKATRKTRK